jgi:hypothetical protein
VIDGPGVSGGVAGEGPRLVGGAVVVVVFRAGGNAATAVVGVLGLEVVVVEAVEVVVAVGLLVVVVAKVVVGGMVVVGRTVDVEAGVEVAEGGVVEVVVDEVVEAVVEVVVEVVPLPPTTATATLSMLMWPSSIPPTNSNLMALVVPANAVRS